MNKPILNLVHRSTYNNKFFKSVCINSVNAQVFFNDCSFSDCEFKLSNLKNSSFEKCFFKHNLIKDCALDEASFENCSFKDNLFKLSSLEYSFFSNVIFHNNKFINCSFEKALFKNSVLSQMNFKLSNLDNFIMEKCAIEKELKISECTLSSSNILEYYNFPNRETILKNYNIFLKTYSPEKAIYLALVLLEKQIFINQEDLLEFGLSYLLKNNVYNNYSKKINNKKLINIYLKNKNIL